MHSLPRSCTILIACGLLTLYPLSIHAMQYKNGPYYASVVGARRNSQFNRLTSATAFLWNHSDHSKDAQKNLICSVRKIVLQERGSELKQILAGEISSMTNQSQAEVAVALSASHYCDEPEPIVQPIAERIPVFVNRDGTVHSNNPVWNACITGKDLSVELLKSNPDVFEHRQGRIRILRPYSCRDYHRGPLMVWKHPDFLDLSVALDQKGRLKGSLPRGYMVKKMEAVAVKKKNPSK
jgi:hypothetical protein